MKNALEEAMHVGDITDACPYLPDKISTLSFGNGLIGGAQYRQLLDRGYRRNGIYLYRPACRSCRACQVIRAPVATFQMNKEQRRRGAARKSLAFASQHPRTRRKRLVLTRYLRFQHNANCYELDQQQYEHFLVIYVSRWTHLRTPVVCGQGELAGVGILDRTGDALSTAYFYFAPELSDWSPGTYSALLEIDLRRQWGLNYYYLGITSRTAAAWCTNSVSSPAKSRIGRRGMDRLFPVLVGALLLRKTAPQPEAARTTRAISAAANLYCRRHRMATGASRLRLNVFSC